MQKIGVIGLGLNGLISAISMKIAGLEVVAFESSDLAKMEKDCRTSALTFETIAFLKELQIYENLKDFIAPINHIYTFEITEKAILSFDAKEVSQNPFGFVIHNWQLKKVLFAKLKSLQIPIISEKVLKIESGESFVEVALETQEILKFKLILNCSGKNSDLFMSAKKREFDYNQTAFVFDVLHEKDHKNIAIESFSSEGPIAILPLLKSQNSAVILTVKTETADYLKSLSKTQFLQEFQKMTSRMKHIGKISKINSDVKSYPLSLSFKPSQVSKRMVFIGDCFNTIHPVAGQSFNMSLKDIKNLYTECKNGIRLGIDVGSETFLKNLARKNLKHHIEMNVFTHFIVRIFSNQSKMLKIFRNIGIRTLENVGPLKKILMQKASGF